ncbi:MAG: tRNA pseudouridine synthase A [Ornithinimicrobium sp.]|uniref:tRNA pseudouridine synthase A n=1 Tax=Ornithinimicrobium sp. TaxID=1977084 RepID=UPI003D9BC6BE
MSADPSVLRLRVDVAYDGTHFSGWAAQPGLRTVEEELAAAWGTMLRTAPPRLKVGGRTDAGVHARGSVVHLDVPVDVFKALPGRSARSPERSAVARLSGLLPSDVVVRGVSVAPPGFDARFSALSRRYSYRICDDPSSWDPLRRHDTVWHRGALDVGSMDAAAGSLLGLHDFAAYCRRREGATTIRTLLHHSWVRAQDGVVLGRFVADAFCHSMVRALVGAVVPVGEGKQDVGWPVQVREAGARHPAVRVMPARGLTLEEITYPGDGEVADRAREARRRRDESPR